MEVEESVIVSPSTIADYSTPRGPSYSQLSHSHRASVGAFERLSSQNSRLSGRHSCRSSVRDEAQTSDELRRKQRVVRFMQIERERAARSILERSEHNDWLRLRSLERSEVVKYMSDEQIVELLQREVQDLQRERLETERTIQRGVEDAASRRGLRLSKGLADNSDIKLSARTHVSSIAESTPSRVEVENSTPDKGGTKAEERPQPTLTTVSSEECDKRLTGAAPNTEARVRGTDAAAELSEKNVATICGATPEANEASMVKSQSPLPVDTRRLSESSTPAPKKKRPDPLSEVMAKLQRAQGDIAALREEVRTVRQAQHEAETKCRIEAERAEKEARAKRMFARHADTHKANVEELQKRITSLEEALSTTKHNEKVKISEMKQALESASERTKALEEENGELKKLYEELREEQRNHPVDLDASDARGSHEPQVLNYEGVPRAVTASHSKPQSEEEEEGENGADASLLIKYHNLTDEFTRLQNDYEKQKLEMHRVNDENQDLRSRLQNTAPANSKRGSIAERRTQLPEPSNDKKEAEQLRKDVRRHKADADELRKELQTLREASANEITGLKEWCERLKVKSKRQTEELKRYIAQHKATAASKEKDTTEMVDKGVTVSMESETAAATAATVEQLQCEISSLRARLSESVRNEQAAATLVRTLKQEKLTLAQREREEEDALRKVVILTEAIKEREGAEAKARESLSAAESALRAAEAQLAATQKRATELEAELTLQREKWQAAAVAQKNSDRSAELSKAVSDITAECEKLREQILAMQQELEREKVKSANVQKEAEERDARSQTEIGELRRDNELLRRSVQQKVKSGGCC
ncbi:unnamed protein product [Trypanosoma congolense IL3000]|uniref:WGS project CAEQ00000000 data, annotated contig 1413 n=1 Tax=Trypanosoma congolense (strain IL3000) TaxID=1068625 RepID=F9W615_TRYCI|nr:unnamed protein product [Trypanosoma congolense IL3000]